MKIDKRLNLVVPIYGEDRPVLDKDNKPIVTDGKPVTFMPVVAYVHSVPLSEEVVDRYFMVIAQTYSAIFTRGLGVAGGPAVAMRLLRQVAKEQGVWADNPAQGVVGVENGLIGEIHRLTNVLVPGGPGGGWQAVPLGVAVDRNFIAAEDRTEVENAIAFFIVASAVLNRSMRRPMLEAASELWGAQITSSTSTELAISLGTSIVTDSSGAKPAAPVSGTPVAANAVVDGKPSSLPY